MTDNTHGLPCWYELTTPDPDRAGEFYGAVIGWSVAKAPMEGFDYYIASEGGTMCAGMMAPQEDGMPSFWCTYFAVTDCDATAAAVVADGGTQMVPPSDIPGTGRFALLTDPQGAVFGILQPLPDGTGGAFDPGKPGHGAWHELMTSDPEAALAFYGKHFGWEASTAMPMGEMGTYQLFKGAKGDMGGMMGLMQPGMPPAWLPYTGVASVDAAKAAIEKAGGKIANGPMEVPGGAWIVQCVDPLGAMFAVTGPK
ncbi:MAG: VOC family protein [Rhodobacteraceae bacterium]|nr:VOC family protein [Paracoccaceae bacterium]